MQAMRIRSLREKPMTAIVCGVTDREKSNSV